MAVVVRAKLNYIYTVFNRHCSHGLNLKGGV